jgi:hypothetical protein
MAEKSFASRALTTFYVFLSVMVASPPRWPLSANVSRSLRLIPPFIFPASLLSALLWVGSNGLIRGGSLLGRNVLTGR